MLTLSVIHIMKLKAYFLITVLHVNSNWKPSFKCKDTTPVRDCNHIPRGNMNSEWTPVFSELASNITDVKAQCHNSGKCCQHLFCHACEWTHRAVHAKRKKKKSLQLVSGFHTDFLWNYNLFNMGRALSTKEMQPNRLLGTVVILESVLAWCVAEATQGTTIIFRYTVN